MNENIQKFINEFSTTLATPENSSILIITGDFNINLFTMNKNRMYFDFFYTVTSYSLYPKITFPTRFTTTNGTLINNFFCKLNTFVLDSAAGIFTKAFSDYQP